MATVPWAFLLDGKFAGWGGLQPEEGDADLSGNFLNDRMAGKAVAISPGKDFIIFGLGISNLGTRKDGWTESGSPIFEAIIASIKFKDEVKR